MKRPRWLDYIEVGDVLEAESGDLRLVRAVSRSPYHSRVHISFAIRHCSWTRRPTTVYNSTDMYLKKMKWVGKYVGEMNSFLDREIEKELAGGARRIFCHHVRRLP